MNVDQIEPVEAAPPASPRSRLRRWLTAVMVALVVAALAAVLVQGWSAVSQYDWRLEPAWFVLGAVLIMLAYTANGLTYGRSVGWLSRVRPSPARGLSIWAKSLLGRYVPGNVMMVVGRAVMAHDQGVPRRVTLAATVYEQALALGVASIAAVIFLAAYGDPGDGNLVWLLAVVPFILAFLHPVPFRRLSTWALRRFGRPPLDTLFTARQVGILFFSYAAGTVPLVVGVWALARSAAGPEIGGVFEIGLAFLLAFVISFMTFILPSGIGVRDGILALAMARHVPGEVALAIAIGLRFALILVELVFVAIAVLVGRRV